jgi:hypothetical protein
MMKLKHKRTRARPIAQIACLAAAPIMLAGCVVVPAQPYHYWPRYY